MEFTGVPSRADSFKRNPIGEFRCIDLLAPA
jgi:hypothetical protein